MRFSKQQMEIHKAQVRRLLVVDHQMTLHEMQKLLAKNGYDFHIDYVSKVREKVLKERFTRVDRLTLNSALASFSDVLGETSQRMWVVLADPRTTASEKVAAARVINDAHAKVFDKLFDAGVFERNLGRATMEHEVRGTIEVSGKVAEKYGDVLAQIGEIIHASGQGRALRAGKE